MKNIENIAVISGASSGIGEAIAKELAKNNITVCLGARSIKKLDKIVDQIRDIGGNAYSFYLDFLDDKSINNFVNNVKRIGTVNTVINNSGFGKFNSIENIEIEDWDKMISVNLRGAFVLCRSFIPNMKKNKSGNIIFINSVAGKYGYPNSTAYVASKYGMRGLADSLRNELRDSNIKVTSIYPGAVDSMFWDNLNVDFPRNEMMNSSEIAGIVYHSIAKTGIGAIEDIVIRRTKGDF